MKVYGMDVRGKLWVQRIAKISYIPWTPADVGRVVFDDASNDIYYGAWLEWKKPQATADLFNTGQEIIFASTPLPTGWNIKTGIADKMVFITNDSTKAGTTAGSWIITGFNPGGSHYHFAPTGLGYANITGPRSRRNIYADTFITEHTHEMFADGTHVHVQDGSWRPAYSLVAVGVFQG